MTGWLGSAGTVDVTPPAGHPLGGYADRDGTAIGTLAPLELNLVWLSDGEHQVVIASLDCLAITRALRHCLATTIGAALGLPANRVLIWASHTHSGPVGWCGQIHPVLPADVDVALQTALADRVRATLHGSSLTPVELRWEETAHEGLGANRHHPDGPHNPSVGVLTVLAQGRPLAVVLDHACHPTVLGPDNLAWSPDWVGSARDAIRRASGAELPVIFGQGASGDVSPRFTRRSRTAAEAHRLGALVGADVVGRLGTGDALTPHLSLARTTIDATPRSHFADTGGEEMGRRSGLAMAVAVDAPDTAIGVSLLRLGGRGWLSLGAEVYTSLADALEAPGLRVIGCADGYAGYLADADAHAEGHYEASASWFDAGETGRIIERLQSWVGSSSTAHAEA